MVPTSKTRLLPICRRGILYIEIKIVNVIMKEANRGIVTSVCQLTPRICFCFLSKVTSKWHCECCVLYVVLCTLCQTLCTSCKSRYVYRHIKSVALNGIVCIGCVHCVHRIGHPICCTEHRVRRMKHPVHHKQHHLCPPRWRAHQTLFCAHLSVKNKLKTETN